MVIRCPGCKARADRKDGTCNTIGCQFYRAARRGGPGLSIELKKTLGCLRRHVDAWIDGGFILRLSHRHDIRVGIASGMYIRQHWPVTSPLRLEILCVLHLCYWRWSTKLLLETLEPRVDEFAAAQPLARAKIWREVWDVMWNEMADKQVLTVSATKHVKLVPRLQIEGLRRQAGKNSGFKAHHPVMNPSSRRPGPHEFTLLMTSLEDGSLWRACEEIAVAFEGDEAAPYSAITNAMKNSNVHPWVKGGYGCVRLARWLLQAEAVRVNLSEDDWDILCNMGEGVRTGLNMCKTLKTYDDAVRLCELISSASSPGEPYELDSLASFLCLASAANRKETASAKGRIGTRSCEIRFPDRPLLVTIAADLEMDPGQLLWPPSPQRIIGPVRHAAAPGASLSLCRFVTMRTFLLFLDIRTHFALRQCGRAACLAGGCSSHWRAMRSFTIGWIDSCMWMDRMQLIYRGVACA